MPSQRLTIAESIARPARVRGRPSSSGLAPLDAAAHAGTLVFFRYGLTGQYRVQRGPQVFPRYRFIVAGPAAIEAAAVGQTVIRVEQEEVGRAGSPISTRYFLAFVEQVRETETDLSGLLAQFLGRVLRMAGDVIGRDGDNADTLVLVLIRHFREALLDVLDVGTMA